MSPAETAKVDAETTTTPAEAEAEQAAVATADAKQSVRDRMEKIIADTLNSAVEKLKAKGRQLTDAQLFQLEADLRVRARRAVAWEPRKKTLKPHSKVDRRRKRQQANKSRRRNRR